MIKKAAQLALDVQDACNLSGVVRSFAQVTDVLWETARTENKGTDYVNRHPISVLFASKINDLARVDYDAMTFSHSYDACNQLACAEEDDNE